LYAEYTDGSFLTAYRQRNIVINQTVTVKYGKELVTGIAKAIDEQGQLLVDTGDVIRTINSGEVLKVQLPNNSYHG
ncbi:MAG: biotin--[acetyl-CoA-carboxylase] ligase, partial [Leuconostoc gelidum]